MTVIVCGGRTFRARKWLEWELDQWHAVEPFTLLVHGDATGADWFAHQWAVKRGVACLACPAQWKKHGKAAGPIRNQQMLDEHKPDHVIAFPGGRGTADMIARAKRAGIKHITIYTNDPGGRDTAR